MLLTGVGRVENLKKENKKVTFSVSYNYDGRDSKVDVEYWKDDSGNDPFPMIDHNRTLYIECKLSNRKKQKRSNASGQWVTEDLLDTSGKQIWEKVFTVVFARDESGNSQHTQTNHEPQNTLQDDDLPF